jgi:membrane protease YdiL (CAAX protease family)
MASSARYKGGGEIYLFFALSLLAWLIWLPQAAHRFGVIGWAPSLQSPLNALTVWSPGLAAVWLTRRLSGSSGVKALFRPLFRWRVPARWYLIALLLEFGIWALAITIDQQAGWNHEVHPAVLDKAFGGAAAFMIPIAVIFTLPNALGEELGWRAFALPRLQAKYGALAASVILGLFWGCWHLPAWVAWRSTEPGFLPVVLLVVNTIPSAVVFTWLFNRTGGSLLIVVLYHASIANKGYFLPSLATSTEAVLHWLLAVLIVIAGGLRPSAESERDVCGPGWQKPSG